MGKNKVNAVYEHGTLRLLQNVDLMEGEKVTVFICPTPSSPPEELPNLILDKICSLAGTNGSSPFSGEDHDKILYRENDSE